MSTLLEQASLVMIPSGYKEDVVYSQIPTSGAGDLFFTRASNGTRVNSAGLVEVTPWNLIENSQNFNAGNWYQENITPTTGQTDPFGASNAFKFLETATTGEHYFFYLFLALTDGVVTQSIYVKSEGRNQILFGSVGSLNSFIFTFSTETISSVTGFTNTSATSLGNGWYRLSATFTASSPINLLFVKGYNGGLSYAGDTSKGFYAFGGQINYGSTAKPYFPTTDRLNVPRLTYQNGGGGCPSLLLEKQSTNLAPYSEDFSQWFDAGGSVSTNTTISPDGTQNADTLTGARYQVGLGTGIFTFSCYAKKLNGDNTFQLRLDVPATISAVYNLDTGTIVSTPSGYSATITAVGNGWYRCTLTNNSSLTITNAVLISATSSSFSTYVWGAQFEASSYPTSYIPTTSSSATRVADACFKTGISSLIGQTSGSVFFDFTVATISAQTNDPVLWYMKDGGSGERYVELYSNGNLEYVEFNGVVIASIIKTGLTVGRHKCAIAYATNDFVFYVDGVQIGTDTSGTPSGFSTFGLQYYNATFNGEQKVNQAALFPTRLTNAELASLTTI